MTVADVVWLEKENRRMLNKAVEPLRLLKTRRPGGTDDERGSANAVVRKGRVTNQPREIGSWVNMSRGESGSLVKRDEFPHGGETGGRRRLRPCVSSAGTLSQRPQASQCRPKALLQHCRCEVSPVTTASDGPGHAGEAVEKAAAKLPAVSTMLVRLRIVRGAEGRRGPPALARSAGAPRFS